MVAAVSHVAPAVGSVAGQGTTQFHRSLPPAAAAVQVQVVPS